MRLLDLFCGGGGAAEGYRRAGFTEIVGVDIAPQPFYPFTFIQDDALDFLRTQGLGSFDAIHASPPCQGFSTIAQVKARNRKPRFPDLIAPTRAALSALGLPYIIENVDGAKKELGPNTLRLTGEMFGLRVHRPRLFELGGWWGLSPAKVRRQASPVAVYGKPDGRTLWKRTDAKELQAWSSIEEGQEALGVPWIHDAIQIAEAIPPAYTEFIGRQLLEQLERVGSNP